jgi:hypothetical protein
MGLGLPSSTTVAEAPPVFVGLVNSSAGDAELHLADTSVPIPLPAIFSGWRCYFDDTQQLGPCYVKRIICGGRWGFVDTFVSCDPKHRRADGMLKLRPPRDGTAKSADATEDVTIRLGCAYYHDRR